MATNIKQVLILASQQGNKMAHVTTTDGNGFIYPYLGELPTGTKTKPSQINIVRQVTADGEQWLTIENYNEIPDLTPIQLRTVIIDKQ